MAWKATGQPTVPKQRRKWVVRVDGIDTVTGKHKPKQLGTCAGAARLGDSAHRGRTRCDPAVDARRSRWFQSSGFIRR